MYELVNTEAKLLKWVGNLTGVSEFVVDTETTSVRERLAHLVGISLAVRNGKGWLACYIPVGHDTGEKNLDIDLVLDELEPLLSDQTKVKIGQNIGYDLGVLANYNIRFRNVHDTMLMSYALTGQKHRAVGHGMDALADFYLGGYRTVQLGDVMHASLGMHDFSKVRVRDAAFYSAEDCEVTGKLYDTLKGKLEAEGLWDLYNDIDRPCVEPIAAMKRNGLPIDRAELSRFETKVRPDVEKLEKWATKEGFNISSPKDVARYLYEVRKFKLKDGSQSTAKEALEYLEDKDETGAVAKILLHRKCAKLVSSFVNAWPEHIDNNDLIHPNYNLCVTVTGRLSGSEPNAQQIPSRDKVGKQIRAAIRASAGFAIGCADYSQIEYRILAHITQAKELLRAYHNGEDLHAAMAAAVRGGKWQDYNDKENEELYAIRTAFKNVNFAVIYGAGPPKVAYMSKISLDEANDILDAHRELVPEVYDWKQYVVREAAVTGYSETLFGRRIHIPGIASRDWGIKGHAERLAVNGVVQGSAADLMRLAVPRVQSVCKQGTKLRATVHDELVLTTPEEKAKAVMKVVGQRMEQAADHLVKWRVPIIVATGVGRTWLEAK